MTSDVDAVFTDEERAVLLEAAADDERQGRLVRCSTAAEVRDLIAALSSAGS